MSNAAWPNNFLCYITWLCVSSLFCGTASSKALTSRPGYLRSYSSGATLSISCQFSSSSSSENFGWYFENNLLTSSGRRSLSKSSRFNFFPFSYTYTGTMRISGLTASDNGIYACASLSSGNAIYDKRSFPVSVSGNVHVSCVAL